MYGPVESLLYTRNCCHSVCQLYFNKRKKRDKEINLKKKKDEVWEKSGASVVESPTHEVGPKFGAEL